MLSPILTLFARISKPPWLNIRSTGAEVAGGQFHTSWVTKTESSWSQVSRPRPRPRLEGSKTKTKTKTLRFQDQDRDRDSRVPRPRPRPRLWGSKTKTETKTCKNVSRDVSRPRLKSRELQVWKQWFRVQRSKPILCGGPTSRATRSGLRFLSETYSYTTPRLRTKFVERAFSFSGPCHGTLFLLNYAPSLTQAFLRTSWKPIFLIQHSTFSRLSIGVLYIPDFSFSFFY